MNPEQFRVSQQIADKYTNISETGKRALWHISDVYGATYGVPYEARLEIYDIVLARINRETDTDKIYAALNIEYVGMLERILPEVRESLYRIDRKSQEKAVIV
jgi:hypothetical protein